MNYLKRKCVLIFLYISIHTLYKLFPFHRPMTVCDLYLITDKKKKSVFFAQNNIKQIIGKKKKLKFYQILYCSVCKGSGRNALHTWSVWLNVYN